MSSAEYRIASDKENRQKGMGLYTRRSYHKSQLIFIEKPLVRIPYKSSQPFMKQLWRHVADDISSHPIVNAFKGMNRYNQKDFLKLHNSRRNILTRADPDPPEAESAKNIFRPTCTFELLGIYLTNFFFLHEDLTGVFKNISRINHACAANAYLVWDRTNGEMRVIAAANIPDAGTEIRIDYSEKFAKLEIFKKLENIREHCRYFYGFWCRCNFCKINMLKGTIQEITPEQERNMISFHLDELEHKLLFKQQAPCWEIRALRAKDSPTTSRDAKSVGQLGMFATRKILKGEPIIGETPIIVLEFHRDQLKGTAYIPSVVTAVQNLDPEERDAYLSLTKMDPSGSIFSSNDYRIGLHSKHLKEIFVSNAVCLPSCCQKDGYCEWGVFRQLSRVNHSCMPNAVGMTYNQKLRGSGQCQHWLHSRRDIEYGEEITISYIESLCTEENVVARASALKDRFMCWCIRCSHDRHGTPLNSLPPTVDYINETPTEYPEIWVERIKALPNTRPYKPIKEWRSNKKKNNSILPPLTSKDILITLNKMPKKKRFVISTKRAGKRFAMTINSLPSMLVNAKQNVSNPWRRKKECERKWEILQRRIKFPECSNLEGKDKGKKRANDELLSNEWSTMSAIMLKEDSGAQFNWRLRNSQTSGPNKNKNSTLDTHAGPNSTSTKLWGSSGGKCRSRVDTPPEELEFGSAEEPLRSPSSASFSSKWETDLGNKSSGAVPFVPQGDPIISDQYYMERLGVEAVTAERLERAKSLSLKSPTDNEATSEELQDSYLPPAINEIKRTSRTHTSDPGNDAAHLARTSGEDDMGQGMASTNNQDRACNITGREAPGLGSHPTLPGDESRVQNRSPSIWSREAMENLSDRTSSSTNTVIKRPSKMAKEESASDRELFPSSPEPTVFPFPVQERSHCKPHPSSTQTNREAESLSSRGRPLSHGAYRKPDQSFSRSSTGRKRQSLNGNGSEADERQTHINSPTTRASNICSSSITKYHPSKMMDSSARGSFYSDAEKRTIQKNHAHERILFRGSPYSSVSRKAISSFNQHESLPSRSLSDSSGRDSRVGIQERDRLPGNVQESRQRQTSDNGRYLGYKRRQLRSESLSSTERRFSIDDSRNRKPQTRANPFRPEPTNVSKQNKAIEGLQTNHEIVPLGGEELAQRARELFDRARSNLPLAFSAMKRAVETDGDAEETESLQSGYRRMPTENSPAYNTRAPPQVHQGCVNTPKIDLVSSQPSQEPTNPPSRQGQLFEENENPHPPTRDPKAPATNLPTETTSNDAAIDLREE